MDTRFIRAKYHWKVIIQKDLIPIEDYNTNSRCIVRRHTGKWFKPNQLIRPQAQILWVLDFQAQGR